MLNNQSINQSIDIPNNQYIDQKSIQLMHKSINQSIINMSIYRYQAIFESINS